MISKKQSILQLSLMLLGISVFSRCAVPDLAGHMPEAPVPSTYSKTPIDSSKPLQLHNSTSLADLSWRDFFQDSLLVTLIDSALTNNQELNRMLLELEVRRSEVLERRGEYLPFVGLGIGADADKSGRFTRNGAVEHELNIEPGTSFPEPLTYLQLGLTASWELDVWRKLRNARDAAEFRWIAQVEERHFLLTQVVAEMAEAYYELVALDNLLDIIQRNLEIQTNALEKMRFLKQSAKANQLAVNRFEAQLLNTQNQRFAIRQRIAQTENRMRFLLGNYVDFIPRNSVRWEQFEEDVPSPGIPSQLLAHRPDIRRVEQELLAARLDVKVARAQFYPDVTLLAGMGFEAFRPEFLIQPESIMYRMAGDLVAPLINRKAIRAQYQRANAVQLQTVYEYQQTVLLAHTDVLNQLAALDNYAQSFDTKRKEVAVLNHSVDVANSLFQFAKADYVEVLLTQEEVLDAQKELVETQLKYWHAKIGLYRALGGGWR